MFLQEIIERIKFPFRKDKELYSSFYNILGFLPRHIELYQQAVRHKSSSIKSKKGWLNNERLEFLGDAVLGAVVGDIVYHHFKNKPEGFLTNTRSNIVKRETLNKIALEIGLDKLIKTSTQTASHNNYMYGNAFEALIGAIYLDRGYAHCMHFMEKQILKRLIDIDKVAYKEVNFKSKLLEWAQRNHLKVEFKLVEQGYENKATQIFVSQVLVEGIECGKKKGYSKRESQQLAAKETLETLKKNLTLHNEIFEAKAKRTAMETEPAFAVPNTTEEVKVNSLKKEEEKIVAELSPESPKATEKTDTLADMGISFDDVSMKPKRLSKEEVIAQAEEQAFASENQS